MEVDPAESARITALLDAEAKAAALFDEVVARGFGGFFEQLLDLRAPT